MNLTSSTATGATDAMSQLVAKVMSKYDTDKDGKLTAAEFGGFLNGLIGANANAAAAIQAAPAASVTVGAFRSTLAGFDFTKLENPNVPGGNTSKYKAARVFQDYPPRPESIPAVIDRLRADGVNATQAGFDKIDFGDGYGPIDVIQGAYPGGGVAWQWLPQ